MTATVEYEKSVTPGDLLKSYLTWQFFSHALYNWERLQGTAFAHTMVPIIRRLYDTKEEISAALKRHLVFFNTQPAMGAVIHGITIAMEEQRANGADISDEAINGLKTALMGPMAGLGDTLVQALVNPILLALFIGMAMEGNFAGPILYIITMGAFVWGLMYITFMGGYRWGRDVIHRILGGGLMRTLTDAASVVGLVVAGVIMVRFVSVTIPVTITLGEVSINIGVDFLDRIAPSLIPLALTIGIWRLLARGISAGKIVIGIFLVGFIGGWLGLLAR
jgi:PTS system mannose-specific IID component